ncbi:hypothetical protein EPI10_016124 [Gossypium australe]|uniref:Uncharacterized protein n=1 Tax=Gossypium australe TaxID=47621 RepID=A0A5B6VMS2_9ROSI|nr:hypothetical protein EPI10_016124 [Gossypium australe]
MAYQLELTPKLEHIHYVRHNLSFEEEPVRILDREELKHSILQQYPHLFGSDYGMCLDLMT